MAKQYNQAPLPFTGQKRNFLKHFKQILQDNIKANGKGWKIVDAFGGSGLLSHTAKQLLPEATVIFNDYDGYIERIKSIEDTNRLRHLLVPVLSDYPKKSRLNNNDEKVIANIITKFCGFLDIDCIASWLLFSGHQVSNLEKLLSKPMYNCMIKKDYDLADDYLKDVAIVSESYKDLIPKYQNQTNTLLVLDPPYICTKQGAYRKATYFGMVEFLRLMSMVKPPFMFFSSTRSELPAYLDFIHETKWVNWQSFENHKMIKIQAHINQQAKYEDNLVYKFY